ncbi:cytochrome P450 family protein [Streptomyces sp. e14]|uniref:cytochrome P450 n=1 Tax=Streptomyces sp. e14 TaxID=645465 RepID=UPI0001D06487|nr:cytochrome P450 [Streptomyces sp. e14]EFF90593.1 cytochrome P450 family protein [Streptomyces sp. e14]
MQISSETATAGWQVAEAPGPLPLVGHALAMAQRPLAFLASLPALGDLVELRIGTKRAHLPCHPELVQQVLLNARVYDTGGPVKDKARPILGNGLITSDWADHRRQRRMVQPAFHPTRIAGYAEVMREECARHAEGWRAGQPVNVSEEMQALTARVTARALFSTEMAPHSVAEIQRSLPVMVHGAYRRAVDPTGLLARLPLAANREFDAALGRLHSLIEGIVGDYRNSRQDRGDLLSALLAVRDDDGAMSDQEVHDQIITLLLAGVETTASALTWAWHLLATHPEAEARLHSEVDSVLGGRAPTYADVPKLVHTQRIFTETLRLYPPAWMFTRTTTEPTELAGVRLPAGADILISPYVIHRVPGLFARPERFDPDRWLPERAKDVTRGSYLPFGGGSRKCIGDVFGTVEATLALAAIASRWRLLPLRGHVVRPRAEMSLTAGPLPMVPQPR